MAETDRPAEAPALHFNAVLHPHRSLGPRGFCLLMGFICTVSFVAGIAFALQGAWPVFGFFGLDALAIYIAFRLSYRSGRLFETVQLSDERLTVRRCFPNGKSLSWSFSAHWVRVKLETWDVGKGAVRLASHGRDVAVGSFLTVEERAAFADALEDALRRLRTRPSPA